MYNDRFYDQALRAIDAGQAQAAFPLLVGKLFSDFVDQESWPAARQALHDHPLHAVLMEDPYLARAAQKPRGYPGDAALIDFAYDQRPPEGTSKRASEMFLVSTGFQASEGVRQRRAYAAQVLKDACATGKRVCALACGHLREADGLIGQNLGNITAVDQDPLSLETVGANHKNVTLECANVIHFLRGAAKAGRQFDLIYTLGLTDYFDERAMSLLHRLMKDCLAPGGQMLIANFLPGHLAIGWMDAVMDWHLIYRDEADMARHAAEIGMTARTFRDSSDSIVFSEMSHG